MIDMGTCYFDRNLRVQSLPSEPGGVFISRGGIAVIHSDVILTEKEEHFAALHSNGLPNAKEMEKQSM
jgi:hypothetical protein